MRRLRDDRGAALVEGVFVLTLLLIPLLIGVIEYGRVLYVSVVLEEAASEGASFMAFSGGSPSDVDAVVKASISWPSLEDDDIDATCNASNRTIKGGVASQVDVTVNYELAGFFISTHSLQQTASAEGSATCAAIVP